MSPDGERIALTVYERTGTGSPTDIYLYTLATGQTRRFTRDGKSRQPVWTRDGKRIVYAVDDPSKTPSVHYMSEPWDQSSPPERFAGADGAEYLELGPAGGYLAQVRTDSSNSANDTQIFIAPVDSAGALRPFAATGMRERWARLSPDGKWLAYHGHEIRSGDGAEGMGGRGGRGIGMGGQTLSQSYVYLSPVPGPGARVQVSKGFGDTPIWSKDSRTLYYFERPDIGPGDSPTMTAAVVTSGGGDVTLRKRNLFELSARVAGGRGLGGVVPAFNPTSLGAADISPAGDFYFLRAIVRNQNTPAAPQPAPRAIIIVNGLKNTPSSATPAPRGGTR